MGPSTGIWCDKVQGAYEGSRKCIPKFCGGKEEEILGKREHHKRGTRA